MINSESISYTEIQMFFINICRYHGWLYYFNEEPPFHRRDARLEKVRLKASTHNQPSFSIKKGIGAEFCEWLQSPFGGDKALKEARQVAKRSMRFLMHALDDDDDESAADENYVDCVIGSPSLLMNFIKHIIGDWELKATGVISYLQAISDLSDFRKAKGCSDSVLRSFSVTEVYLRKCKSAMHRRKNMEYTRDLNLETLMARNSWTTLSEMEEVIPFHTGKFMEIIKKCREGKDPVSIGEVIFGTRFLCTFLFLRVKATRPMSIQFLTTQHIEHAKSNGGFVDSTQFKTSKEYIFDSLKFTESALVVIEKYIKYIRPLCKPISDCHYVLINSRGSQFTALGSAMSLMVHLAIGKHINPTRYRQIVETASGETLTQEQQETVSMDQKHSSLVAKRFVYNT